MIKYTLWNLFLALSVSHVASAECPNFSGKWKGVCEQSGGPGRSHLNLALDIKQTGCDQFQIGKITNSDTTYVDFFTMKCTSEHQMTSYHEETKLNMASWPDEETLQTVTYSVGRFSDFVINSRRETTQYKLEGQDLIVFKRDNGESLEVEKGGRQTTWELNCRLQKKTDS